MEMHPLRSSNIGSIGYDPSTKELRVNFKTGSRYVLSDVPPECYENFLKADSPGRFYAQNCAKAFKFRRLKEDEE